MCLYMETKAMKLLQGTCARHKDVRTDMIALDQNPNVFTK